MIVLYFHVVVVVVVAVKFTLLLKHHVHIYEPNNVHIRTTERMYGGRFMTNRENHIKKKTKTKIQHSKIIKHMIVIKLHQIVVMNNNNNNNDNVN